MGCWMMFRGSLQINPPISDEDRRAFGVFYPKGSEFFNFYDNYSNPWFVNDEGRLECIGCKFGEYSLWMQILYDQFFDPRGYDVYGTLLVSGEGSQFDWSVVRFDNGKELYTHHIDDVHVDLNFWEEEAKYAKQFREEHPPNALPSKSRVDL